MLEFNNSHIPPLFANKHKYHKICCKSNNSSTQQYDETYGNITGSDTAAQLPNAVI